MREKAEKEGFYLELLWARRHGFTPDREFLAKKDYRPASLSAATSEKLRQWYMETRPEVVLFDTSFWTAPQPQTVARQATATVPCTGTCTSQPVASASSKLLGKLERSGDGTAGLNGIGVISDWAGRRRGTGFLVSECHVLTSKHGVFDAPVYERPLKQVHFSAGESGTAATPFLKTNIEGRVIAYGNYAGPEWTTNGDWALVQLSTAIGKELGYLPLYHQMTHQKIKGRQLVVAGYANTDGNSSSDSGKLVAITECQAEGVRVINGNIVQSCQAVRGLSGGPVLTRAPNGQLYGVGMATTLPWGGAMAEAPYRTSVGFESGKDMDLETDGDSIVFAMKAHPCN